MTEHTEQHDDLSEMIKQEVETVLDRMRAELAISMRTVAIAALDRAEDINRKARAARVKGETD